MIYINPYFLLGYSASVIPSISDQELHKAKKKFFLQLQLSDNRIEYKGLDLTISKCREVLDELNEPDKKFFHNVIAQENELYGFLTTCDVRFFSTSHNNPVFQYDNFKDLIFPYYNYQFNKVLKESFINDDIFLIESLSKQDIYNDQKSLEELYKPLIELINKNIEFIKAFDENKIKKVNSFNDAVEFLLFDINPKTLNTLPVFFQELRNNLANSLRTFSILINNIKKDYKSAYLLIKAAKDIKTDVRFKTQIAEAYKIIEQNFNNTQVKKEPEKEIRKTIIHPIEVNSSESKPFQQKQEKKESSNKKNDTLNIDITPREKESKKALLIVVIFAIIYVCGLFFYVNFDYFINKEKSFESKSNDQLLNLAKYNVLSPDSAIVYLNVLLKRDSNNSEGYFQRGMAKQSQRNFEGAIKDLSKALLNGYDKCSSYEYIGFSYNHLRKYDSAKVYFQKSLESYTSYDSQNGKDMSAVKYYLAKIENVDGEFYKSLELCNDIRIPNIWEAEIMCLTSKNQFALKKFNVALKSINRCIKLEPKNGYYYYVRAKVKEHLIGTKYRDIHLDFNKAIKFGFEVPSKDLESYIPQIETHLNGNITGCGYSPIYPNKKIDNYLEIKVGNTDVAVKLINTISGKCVRYVFINSNSTYFIRNIPEGFCKLKIAYGKDWMVEPYNNFCNGRFTKNTFYEKGKEVIDFNIIKDSRGHQIPSFSLVLNVIISESSDEYNNFISNKISEDEFYNE